MTCDDSDHCITCSDETVAMRVVEARDGALAVCADEAGQTSEVMVDLVAPVVPGETLLVHAGVALTRAAA